MEKSDAKNLAKSSGAKFKALFLMLFIILAGTCPTYESALAADTEQEKAKDPTQDLNTAYEAWQSTGQQCLLDVGMMVDLTASVGVGIAFLVIDGVAANTAIGTMMAPDPTFISKVIAAANLVFAVADAAVQIVNMQRAITESGQVGQCALSFVRDPVERYLSSDKNYPNQPKQVISPQDSKYLEFGPVDPHTQYYKALPAHESDTITVCARDHWDWRGVFGALGSGSIMQCETGKSTGYAMMWNAFSIHKLFEKFPNYDGPEAVLCPEEFRAVGRLQAARTQGSKIERNGRTLGCTNWNIADCGNPKAPPTKDSAHNSCAGFGVSSSISGDTVVNNSMEKFKLLFGSKKCVELDLKDNKKKALGGSIYQAYASGKRICVRLIGPETPNILPSKSQSYEIGCHLRKTYNAFPGCPKSLPIYENRTLAPDGTVIDRGSDPTGDGTIKITDYDNSPCYIGHCGLSTLCVGRSGLFQSGFPTTAYIMGCVRDSVSRVVLGCNKVDPETGKRTTAKTGGLLEVVQKKFRPLIIAVVVLSVLLFGFNMLFPDTMPKPPEMIVYVLKIGSVLYFTSASGSENGMKVFFNIFDSITGTLQSVMMSSATSGAKEAKGDDKATTGFCDFRNVSYADSKNLNTYEYLRAWDELDCRLLNYFAGGGFSNMQTPGFGGTTILHYMSAIGSWVTYPLFILAFILIFWFLICVVIEVCELVIVSSIIVFVLVLVSPLFIPLLLFKYTNQMFTGWLNQLSAFMLYPVLVFGFLSFMFSAFDLVFLGRTKFQAYDYRLESGATVRRHTVDPGGTAAQESCRGFNVASDASNYKNVKAGDVPQGCDCNGLQCALSSLLSVNKESGGFVTLGKEKDGCPLTGNVPGIQIVSSSGQEKLVADKLKYSLLAVLVTVFVFYMLTKQIHSLLASISGGTMSIAAMARTAGQRGSTPHSRFESGLGRVQQGISYAASGDKEKSRPNISSVEVAGGEPKE